MEQSRSATLLAMCEKLDCQQQENLGIKSQEMEIAEVALLKYWK